MNKPQVNSASLDYYMAAWSGTVAPRGCRLQTNHNDDFVVGNIKEKTLAEISRGDEAWGIIKGFYEGKRPHTCLECTFYQPINQGWFEERAKDNGVASKH